MSSRASHVLERLATERQRTALFTRGHSDSDRPAFEHGGADPAGADSGGVDAGGVDAGGVDAGGVDAGGGEAGGGAGGDDPEQVIVRRHRPSARSEVSGLLRRRGPIVAAAAVATLVVAGWFVLARPGPIEERLPIVQTVAEGSQGEHTRGDTSTPEGTPLAGAGEPTDDAQSTDVGPSAAAGDSAGDDGSNVVVHVAGAVAAPGVVHLVVRARVVDAVAAAGGLRADADTDRINLAAPLTDGARIFVPALGQPLPVEVVPVVPAPGSDAAASDQPAALVDVNSATAEQLESLPGVGPATAATIVAHRDEFGPFDSVEGLLDVRGIGDAKLDAIRDLVSVGPGG